VNHSRLRWHIKTDQEIYIEALEKRIKLLREKTQTQSMSSRDNQPFEDDHIFDIESLPIDEVRNYNEEDDLLGEMREDLEYNIHYVKPKTKPFFRKYKQRNTKFSKRCFSLRCCLL